MPEPAASALPSRTDVVIVGAGPTGLALAVTLASAGVDCVVLDARAAGITTSRAAAVHARTLEVLEELGAAAELVDRGLPVSAITLREGGRRLARIRFDRLPTRYPYVLAVPQYETEDVLRGRLRALGRTVHRPWTVTAVRQDGDGVDVTAEGPGGPATLRAAYAVGADGMHSTVREEAGIGFRGGSYDESFVLADAAVEWAPGRGEVAVTFAPAGVLATVPLPHGLHRLVATVAGAPPRPGPAFVQGLLDDRLPGGGRIRELVWSSRFLVHHRVADRYRRGRLVLAGDAAHVHSPVGGQGMNIGVQDGFALGHALADVLLRGAAPRERLDAYEAARRPVAARVVALTDRMTRVVTARGPLGRTLRHAVLPLIGGVPALNDRLAGELAELTHR